MSIDPRATAGFGSSAASYERGRPRYPQEALEHLAREFGLTRASTVLDLAAGTGKLTRQLLPLAGRVIAVEPTPGMLEELRRQVPEADAREGTAEQIPLEDDSVDAVFVGQAFHWFRPAEALGEIARVLRPGGGLAMLWNQTQWGKAELAWGERFEKLVEPLRVAAGPFPAGGEQWKPALERDPRFSPRQDAQFTHVHRTSVEDFLALVASLSWIANLPDGERSELLREVREMAGEDELALPHATEVYWTRLKL
jgi:SAM-dependent methyltransferase